ncbi:MAG TPA: hypothetical protein PLM34_10220, partial [Lentimicrobium sp.]|nr:hypothetical protein [Lentimicrobium sp.]
ILTLGVQIIVYTFRIGIGAGLLSLLKFLKPAYVPKRFVFSFLFISIFVVISGDIPVVARENFLQGVYQYIQGYSDSQNARI